jgi:hypothetical protein
MDLGIVKVFHAELERHIPGFRIAFKDESVLHKLIGVLLCPFNPSYMTSFTTTIGKVVYFPSRDAFESDLIRSFSTLAHEFIHAWDYEHHRLWFVVSYLMPQLFFAPLVVLALLGLLWSKVSLLLLIPALVSMAPWPSHWRAHWEKRGYAMTLACSKWARGSISESQKESIAENFYGPNYYFMTWGKQKACDLVDEMAAYAASPHILKEEPYYIVYSFMKSRGLTR